MGSEMKTNEPVPPGEIHVDARITWAKLHEMPESMAAAVVEQLVRAAERSRVALFQRLGVEDRLMDSLEIQTELRAEIDQLRSSLDGERQKAQGLLVRTAEMEGRAQRGDAAYDVLKAMAEMEPVESAREVLTDAVSELDSNYPVRLRSQGSEMFGVPAPDPASTSNILQFPRLPTRTLSPDPDDDVPVED